MEEIAMKKAAVMMVLLAMLFAVNIAGCCFGEPGEGQICFIIIPLPGVESGSLDADFTVEQVDCNLVK